MDLEMSLKLMIIIPIGICAAVGVFYMMCRGFISLYDACQKVGKAIEKSICIIVKYCRRIKNRKSGRV